MFPRTICSLYAFGSTPKPVLKLYSQQPKLYPACNRRETFYMNLDVRSFNRDEIRVEAGQDYVLIEGKQEKNIHQGYILRHFVNRFKLPDGCSPKDVKCWLRNDGILAVKAERPVIWKPSTPAKIKA